MDEDKNIGTARIVYEHPEKGTVEKTVQNEHLAYFQDHWMVKTDDSGETDTVRRIPVERVHYVEREVEAFEDEIKSFRKQVESLADEVRSKLPGRREYDDEDVTRIDVETGEER